MPYKFKILKDGIEERDRSIKVKAEVEGEKQVKIFPKGEGWLEEMSIKDAKSSDIEYSPPSREDRRKNNYTNPPRLAEKFVEDYKRKLRGKDEDSGKKFEGVDFNE